MERTITFEYTDGLILKNLRYSLGLRNFLLLGLIYALFSGFAVIISSVGGEDLRRVMFVAVAIIALLGAAWYWYSYFNLGR